MTEGQAGSRDQASPGRPADWLPANWIVPDWPAPARVRALVTTRIGGVSQPPYDDFNLGDHVGDDRLAVLENRQALQHLAGCWPAWLEQVHGIEVVEANPRAVARADASFSHTPGVACAIMTADCLPVLFCDREGTRVAAAHAGWRSLCDGVLEATLDKAFAGIAAQDVLVWLGPAIGPQAFEVGPEVREAFLAAHAGCAEAFVPSQKPGHFLCDMYRIARIRLASRGVTAVYGGGLCTFSDPQRFYSFRRDQVTGRMASLIWLKSR